MAASLSLFRTRDNWEHRLVIGRCRDQRRASRASAFGKVSLTTGPLHLHASIEKGPTRQKFDDGFRIDLDIEDAVASDRASWKRLYRLYRLLRAEEKGRGIEARFTRRKTGSWIDVEETVEVGEL